MNHHPGRPQALPPTVDTSRKSWDYVEIGFHIRNRDHVHDIGLCDELPLGWVVGSATPIGPDSRTYGYMLKFEVYGGDVLERDGAIVRRILGRLGCL